MMYTHTHTPFLPFFLPFFLSFFLGTSVLPYGRETSGTRSPSCTPNENSSCGVFSLSQWHSCCRRLLLLLLLLLLPWWLFFFALTTPSPMALLPSPSLPPLVPFGAVIVVAPLLLSSASLPR